MKKIGWIILLIVVVSGCTIFGFASHYINNKVEFVHNKIDEATSYELKKEVEDSCRAMISSYEADKLVYEQYKDSTDSEQKSWADQAKMRANRTASNYNNYILKNSYVWKGNVPTDIRETLDIVE